jgi:hypothetical protein
VKIRIEARILPGSTCDPNPDVPDGYQSVHVGVQHRNRRGQLLGLVPGDAPSVTWDLECMAVASPAGVDLKGPQIQDRPGTRFIYLAWGTADDDGNFALFRRAKLQLDAVPADVIQSAVERGVLVGRLSLTDRKGHPVCAAVRPQ